MVLWCHGVAPPKEGSKPPPTPPKEGSGAPSFPSGGLAACVLLSCVLLSCRAQLLPSLPRGGAGGGVPIFLYVNLPRGWGNNAKRLYKNK